MYLTIDLDVLPASVAPGVSAPAALGVDAAPPRLSWQVAGDERYTEAPEKNQYSHIHDSIHYVCLKFALPQTQRSRPQAGYAPLDRTIGL